MSAALATLTAWVEAHSAEVPARELECFLLLSSGGGARTVAREMGVSRRAVREWIARLRRRAGL